MDSAINFDSQFKFTRVKINDKSFEIMLFPEPVNDSYPFFEIFVNTCRA